MALFSLNFPSKHLNQKIDVNVVLPEIRYASRSNPQLTGHEFYQGGKKYPVIWLLHGAGGDHNDWIRRAPLEKIANEHNIMFVCPNAMAEDYSNYSVFGGGFDFPSFLFEELMPMVYGWLPGSERSEDNYVCGFSMGGNGALVLSLVRPDAFAAAGAFAGSIRDVDDLRPWRDMTSDQFRVEGFDTTRFHGIYPPGFTKKEVNMIAKYPTVGDFLDSIENTWDRYIEVFDSGKLPQIWVGVGSLDRCTGRVAKFKKLARELGDDKTVFTEIPGHSHTYDMAAIALNNFIDFCGL